LSAAGINDVDEETLATLQTTCNDLLACHDPWLKDLLTTEHKCAQKRLAMWGRSTSCHSRLAASIFAQYPGCADEEMLEIMIDQGCTVLAFNFWNNHLRPPASLSTINNEFGVQLLNCPLEWLPYLPQQTQLPPRHIIGITSRQDAGGAGISQNLSAILEENRLQWATDTLIPDGQDVISRLCILKGFKADLETLVTSPLSQQVCSILVFKTRREGMFCVNVVHNLGAENVLHATLTLHDTRVDVAEGEWSVKGRGDILQHDSFTVDVQSPGVHQIEITFRPMFIYRLRKVWVSSVRDGQITGIVGLSK
jgi:hypothetical protein